MTQVGRAGACDADPVLVNHNGFAGSASNSTPTARYQARDAGIGRDAVRARADA
jgi:hypothetical protein